MKIEKQDLHERQLIREVDTSKSIKLLEDINSNNSEENRRLAIDL